MGKVLTLADQKKFIEKIAPLAIEVQKKTGIAASVTIAQAILESDWERSPLASKFNNYFGIKDSARFDEGVCEFDTTEVIGGKLVHLKAKFEAFKDAASCFDARGRMLSESKRYAPAMAQAHDPFVFADLLKQCGYSTDPDYGKKIGALITRYKLDERFDAPKRKEQQS